MVHVKTIGSIFLSDDVVLKIEGKRMIIRYSKTVDAEGSGKEKNAPENQAAAGSKGACRCKETSKMTPGELLRLMISDLTFWKKAKKR